MDFHVGPTDLSVGPLCLPSKHFTHQAIISAGYVSCKALLGFPKSILYTSGSQEEDPFYYVTVTSTRSNGYVPNLCNPYDCV